MVIPQEALTSLSIQQKEGMPHGAPLRPGKTEEWTTAAYLHTGDSSRGKKHRTSQHPVRTLCVYRLLTVVGFISVNSRDPLRKQDDVLEDEEAATGGQGQQT